MGQAMFQGRHSYSRGTIALMMRRTLGVAPAALAVYAIAVSLGCRGGGTKMGAEIVAISNEGSNDVTLIDTDKDEVVATVPVGKRPRGMRLSADGKRLFVALSGSPRTPPGGAAAEKAEAADREADGI